ncbi:hypothetical protein HNR61_009072 [Actinomadura namibiensis]|uniref:Uncharacterized protein n=1 Tax=Actinomadura namibiensis TaxID=182080 RepID=A0A7W3LZT9_ACTNM|nr:hypothetical protein [Actinomadura namibiensis]
MKFELGLFDRPYVDLDAVPETLHSAEIRGLARRITERAGRPTPQRAGGRRPPPSARPDTATIAMIGPNTDHLLGQLDNYSHPVLDGMTKRFALAGRPPTHANKVAEFASSTGSAPKPTARRCHTSPDVPCSTRTARTFPRPSKRRDPWSPSETKRVSTVSAPSVRARTTSRADCPAFNENWAGGTGHGHADRRHAHPRPAPLAEVDGRLRSCERDEPVRRGGVWKCRRRALRWRQSRRPAQLAGDADSPYVEGRAATTFPFGHGRLRPAFNSLAALEQDRPLPIDHIMIHRKRPSPRALAPIRRGVRAVKPNQNVSLVLISL